MNIKAGTKYQINEHYKSIRIFYPVVFLVIAFFIVVISVNSNSEFITIGGLEWSTMIFLFILGLNSFKESFLMMLQNNISRKTMFASRLLAVLITSSTMAVIDRLIVNVGGIFNDVSEKFFINGLYEGMFSQRAESLHVITLNLEAILVTIFVYTAAMVVGYFIALLYYRMNKVAKVAVSIGVPSTIFVLLPLLNETVFNGRLFEAFRKIVIFVFGGETVNPYNLLLTCVLFIIVCLGLSWLLIRKAVEKN